MIPKPTDHAQSHAAREAYLRKVARRPGRRRRGSTRVEALAVVMLGLAVIAFPWGRLGPSRDAEAQTASHVRLEDAAAAAFAECPELPRPASERDDWLDGAAARCTPARE